MNTLFKNALFYQLTQPAAPHIEALKEKADDFTFVPCSDYESCKIGFTDILPGILDEQIVSLGDVTLFAVKRQEKKLPAAAVRELTEEKVAEIETAQERKVYRKEKKQIQEDIYAMMLPKMPPVSQVILGYIDPVLNLVVIDTTSIPRAEDALNLIRDAVGSFPVKALAPSGHPATVMTGWLQRTGIPEGLAILDEAKLRSEIHGGEAAVMKNTDLSGEPVKCMIEGGMVVEHLRLIYRGIEFNVTDDANRLKRIVWPEKHEQPGEAELLQIFESDIAAMTGEIRLILSVLGAAFGGWLKQQHIDLEAAGEQ